MENESSPGKRSLPALALWEARWWIFGGLFLIAYLIDGFFGMYFLLTGASGARGGSALFVPILSVFTFIFALRKTLLPQKIFLILPLFQFLLVILPVAPPTWPVWPLLFIQLILGTYGLYAFRPARTPDIDRIFLEKERARAYGWLFLVAYLIDGFAGIFFPSIGSEVRVRSIFSIIIISVFVLTFALRKTLLPQHVFLILPLFQIISVITLAQKWLTGLVWPLLLIQGTLQATLGIYGVYVFRSAKDASRLKEQPRLSRESMSYVFLGIIFICVVTLYAITPFIELSGQWNVRLNIFSFFLLPFCILSSFCVIKRNKFPILIAEMLLLFLLSGLEYELRPFARRIVFDFKSPELNTFVKEIGDYARIQQMTVKGYSGHKSLNIRGSETRLGADIGIGSIPHTLAKYSIDEKIYEKFSHKLEKIHCTEFQSKDNYIYFRISGSYGMIAEHSYGWLYLKEAELPKSVDTFSGSFHKLDDKWYFFDSY